MIFSMVITVVLLVTSIKSTLLEVKNDDKSDVLLAKAAACVVEIVYANQTNYVTIRRRFSQSNYHRMDDTTNLLIKFIGTSTTAVVDASIESTKSSVTYNIILIDDEETTYDLVEKLKKLKLYGLVGHNLYVILEPPSKLTSTLLELFTIMWRMNAVDVNIMVPNTDTNTIEMYTYFPYSPHVCGRVIPVLLNTFVNDSFVMPGPLFPDKVSNFFGCPVIVGTQNSYPFTFIKEHRNGTLSVYGIEGYALQTIAERLNFTAHIMRRPEGRGTVFSNGSSTGIIKALHQQIANISVGSYSAAYFRGIVDNSYVWYYAALTFAIVDGDLVAPIKKLVMPFRIKIWILITVCLVTIFVIEIMSLLILPAHRFRMRLHLDSVVATLNALNLISTALGGTWHGMSRFSLFRVGVALWLIGWLILRTLYQGSMFDFMQQQKFNPPMDSVDKIMMANLPFYLNPPHQVFFIDQDPEILKRVIFYSEFYEIYFRKLISHEIRGAVFATEEHVAYFNYLQGPNGTLKVIKKRLFLSQLVFGFCKNSYFTKPINSEIRLLVESGLIAHWVNLYIDDKFLRPRIGKRLPAPLTNDHLLGSYELMAILLAGALFTFLLECLAVKIKILKEFFNVF